MAETPNIRKTPNIGDRFRGIFGKIINPNGPIVAALEEEYRRENEKREQAKLTQNEHVELAKKRDLLPENATQRKSALETGQALMEDAATVLKPNEYQKFQADLGDAITNFTDNPQLLFEYQNNEKLNGILENLVNSNHLEGAEIEMEDLQGQIRNSFLAAAQEFGEQQEQNQEFDAEPQEEQGQEFENSNQINDPQQNLIIALQNDAAKRILAKQAFLRSEAAIEALKQKALGRAATLALDTRDKEFEREVEKELLKQGPTASPEPGRPVSYSASTGIDATEQVRAQHDNAINSAQNQGNVYLQAQSQHQGATLAAQGKLQAKTIEAKPIASKAATISSNATPAAISSGGATAGRGRVPPPPKPPSIGR